MNRGYVDQYRRNSVETASPLQLILMLYDGALRFIALGRAGMQARNLFQQNENLQKAQRIVMELTSCLDMKAGGEVATNLFGLYTFVHNELVTGNMMDDEACLDRAVKILEELRTGWAELDARNKVGQQEQRIAS